MSSYFTLPSFARAKKNKEELEKSNPQDPVLKDEDENFLNKQISTDPAAPQESEKVETATQIADDGQAKEVPKEEAGDVVVPETQPESKGEEQHNDAPDPEEQDPLKLDGASYDDAMKEKATEAKKARKAKKDNDMELPSQEEAEAATQRGFQMQGDQQQSSSQDGKRTWASYLPAKIRPGSRKGAEGDTSSQTPNEADKTEQTQEGASEDQHQQPRTWTEYASSYVPNSWTTKRSKKIDPDAKPEPVYNEDGTINEEATKEKQEREVSVLLDNLNLSSINNRVFPLTQETQKLYQRFAQCLKDVINGVPTAYDDMEQLMKEAGPKLEEQWKQMPPFVQTLVKSLPAKMGSVVGPEVLAMASEQPGGDMKKRMEAASKPSAGAADSGLNIASADAKGDEKTGEKKSKRRIPGLKSLVGDKSAVAGILRSVVNFLQTRFPFLASTTNVVMSLAVFILMFVFWYCHKRGKEVRLAKEAAAAAEGGDAKEVAEDDGEDDEIEVTDEDDEDADDEEAQRGDEAMVQDVNEKLNVLSQPDPTEVPIPDDDAKPAAGSDEKTEAKKQ